MSCALTAVWVSVVVIAASRVPLSVGVAVSRRQHGSDLFETLKPIRPLSVTVMLAGRSVAFMK